MRRKDAGFSIGATVCRLVDCAPRVTDSRRVAMKRRYCQAMSSGIFAIIGVALGSALTYLVQSHMARRAEDFAQRERLRRERMDVYSAFAARTMDARRAQINRWYQRTDKGRGTKAYEDAKSATYRERTAARREQYRVKLVATDQGFADLAVAAVDSLRYIPKTESKVEMEERADRTRDLVEQFVVKAGSQLLARTDA